MSYRHHVAREDVLIDPGECDVTAHVDWDALISEAEVVGWKQEWMGTVQSALVALGEEAVREMATKNAAMFKTFMGNFAAGFDVLLLRKGP
jgi:SAM-dependent MidA family methyltransferase